MGDTPKSYEGARLSLNSEKWFIINLMELTWFGTASVLIQGGASFVLMDPFNSRNSKLPALPEASLLHADAYLLTHGHFDHVADVTELVSKYKKSVYGHKPLVKFLVKAHRLPENKTKSLDHGESISIGAITATAFKAKHIKFDLPLVAGSLGKLARSGLSGLKSKIGTLASTAKEHRKFPEISSTAWLFECRGIRVLHFGSLGLDDSVKYPEGVDLLSLPYQGHSKIEQKALEACKRLKPRAVFLHHFDDSFPPITQYVSTQPFIELMNRKMPSVQVLIPKYGKPEHI